MHQFGSSSPNMMNYMQIQSPFIGSPSNTPSLPILAINNNAPMNANIVNTQNYATTCFPPFQVNHINPNVNNQINNIAIIPVNNLNYAMLAMQSAGAHSVHLPICLNNLQNVPISIASAANAPTATASIYNPFNSNTANNMNNMNNISNIMLMTQNNINCNVASSDSVLIRQRHNQHAVFSGEKHLSTNHNHRNNNNGAPSMATIACKDKDSDKAFCCSECGKLFKHRHNLNIHWRMHNQQAFECPFCDKQFARKANLMQHTRVHTDYRPWKCSYCSKAFKQKKCLIDHLRTHSGERPFICEFCKKAFTVKHNLMSHRRLHTGQRPYECALCVKKFVSKSSLNSHTRRKHPHHWDLRKLKQYK